jgi:hypothetical protein
MVVVLLAVLAPLALIALASGAICLRGGCERCPAHPRVTARTHALSTSARR